jgi:hypothetical protein
MERYKENNWIKIGSLGDRRTIDINADTYMDWINNDLFFVNLYRIAKDLGPIIPFVILGDPDNQDTVMDKLLSMQNKLIVGDVVVEFIKSYHIKPIESPIAEYLTDEPEQVLPKRKKK